MSLDFGELWKRANPKRLTKSELDAVIHDAELEVGIEQVSNDEARLSLRKYNDGVLTALYELREIRGG